MGLTLPLLEILVPALGQNTKIESVDLSSNGIEDVCGPLLCKIIQAQSEERDHTVWIYGLRGEYPSHLEKQGLRKVNFSRNYLSTDFAKSLNGALRNDYSLKVLDLRFNKFKGVDIDKEILLGLKGNQSVTILDLRFN